MKNLGFSHYNLRAPRALLDELRDFYRDVVGLAPGARPPLARHGYWLYAGDRDVLHLSEANDGEVRLSNVQGTFDHVAFACTGMAAFRALLTARAIPYRVGGVPHDGPVQIFFSDPAGNGVELNFANEPS